LQKEGYLAEVITEKLDFSPDEDFELLPEEKEKLRIALDLPDSVIRRLGADHKRNFLIITRLIEEIQNDNKILVFACSVEHAHLLANILSAKNIRAAAITSKTKSIRRRILIDQYRNSDDIQILINYGVLTAGFDAPKTNIAMITRPTQSVVLYSQMVGRASRGPKAGGNKKCKIITIVDQIPGFRALSEAFAYWDDLWE
jgi:superfamily II DNA or RNA helicase